MSKAGRRAMLFLLMAMLAWIGGCDLAPCTEVQQSYEQNLRRESSFQQLSDQGAPHLGMAIRLDLLNDLTNRLLNGAVGQALSHRGTLQLAGQNVGYGISSSSANLRLDASSQCRTCVRVRGDIGGRLEATLPVVGRQSSPLSGGIDWTVPLAVSREDDGKAAVFIDTAEAMRMGTPRIQNLAVSALPSNWSSLVESALVTGLAEEVAQKMPALRLFGYEMPNLGIQGLEMTPSLFAFDSRSNALVLGVRTNLPISESRAGDGDMMRAFALSEGQNIALGIQPGAVLEAVRLGMQQNRVPRRYNLTGEANRRGPAHVLVDRFQVGSHQGGRDALALGLDFRVFNFGSGWGCFSMNGNALSRLQVQNGRVELEVEGVNFTGNALADAANWGTAQFIRQTETVVSRTLNDDVVFSPDVGMSLRGDRVSTEGGMLILRGAGSAR